MTLGFVLAILLAVAPPSPELAAIRARIDALGARLEGLERSTADAREQRERLDAELALAEARVREVELQLGQRREQVEHLKVEVQRLGGELEGRQRMLRRQLEMVALLGPPGPLQLLLDAVRGGELERAVDTVAVLTAGQARLVEEYVDLQQQRGTRMAELSRSLEGLAGEAAELERRRGELGEVRARVSAELQQLERSRAATRTDLEDLRQRERSLERLMGVLAGRERLGPREDVRAYRGALPWPAEGRIVERFGRHAASRYATYTVCNGLRLAVPSGAEVTASFPGTVAYAQHFKGYGNMVVIDHGQQVYSVVAGLATIHVRRDERVALGARLGLAPPPSADGNLYLEIRVAGQPQDPLRWLRLREAGS